MVSSHQGNVEEPKCTKCHRLIRRGDVRVWYANLNSYMCLQCHDWENDKVEVF